VHVLKSDDFNVSSLNKVSGSIMVTPTSCTFLNRSHIQNERNVY